MKRSRMDSGEQILGQRPWHENRSEKSHSTEGAVFPARMPAAMSPERMAKTLNSLIRALRKRGVDVDLPMNIGSGVVPESPSQEYVDRMMVELARRVYRPISDLQRSEETGRLDGAGRFPSGVSRWKSGSRGR